MHVGMCSIFQNPNNAVSDQLVYSNEVQLAELAEPLGFQSIWTVEHHFTNYTISRPEDMRNSVLADHFMIGTPEQVSEKLSQFQIDFTCTDLIMGTQFPGLNPKLGTNALKLFGEKVMPKFRK